ncbi:hypothetical protein [Oculatella sp. LEGE 06141]|uniref:hypothetical protein n=2 Tax=Oculatella sp. LEGE 06141 TaxID=1828648 RepID=UPI0018805036
MAQLIQASQSWEEIKKNYLEFPELMSRFLQFRDEIIAQATTTILGDLQGIRTLLTEHSGILLDLPPAGMIVAGSNTLSSDYDVTFYSQTENKKLELSAVRAFYDYLYQEWGKPPGIKFDANAYTTGHLRPEAFKGDGLKLSCVNRLSRLLEDIKTEGWYPSVEQTRQINDLVAGINAQETIVKTSLAPIEANNFIPVVSRVADLQRDLRDVVRQQYQSSKDNYGTGGAFDEIAIVMALVALKNSFQTDWPLIKQTLTQTQKLETTRKLTIQRCQAAENIHQELTQKGLHKVDELRSHYPDRDNSIIEQIASNQLYLDYLEEISDRFDLLEQPHIDKHAIKKEIHGLQSKALFFANEAYMTPGAVEQVVLNQQLGLGVELSPLQYQASILEQTAFIGAQIQQNQGEFGTALRKTAKYLDRLIKAAQTINYQTQGQSPSQDISKQLRATNPLVNQILSLKYSQLSEAKKDQQAAAIATSNPSIFGSTTHELKDIILNLQINIYRDVQGYISEQNAIATSIYPLANQFLDHSRTEAQLGLTLLKRHNYNVRQEQGILEISNSEAQQMLIRYDLQRKRLCLAAGLTTQDLIKWQAMTSTIARQRTRSNSQGHEIE